MGFAGIRSLKEVVSLLQGTPEVQQLPQNVRDASKKLVDDHTDEIKLRSTFEAYLAMEGKEVEDAVRAFCLRVKDQGVKAFDQCTDISSQDRELLAEATGVLDEFNAGDGSIFVSLSVIIEHLRHILICSFFMNLMELKEGEGMYVGADGPHAWLKGDIVELMAVR